MTEPVPSIFPARTRVLVVDDEPEITAPMQRYLRLLGYRVDAVETGERALELLARERYHVAVIDIRLPAIDGIEVMRCARALLASFGRPGEPPWRGELSGDSRSTRDREETPQLSGSS